MHRVIEYERQARRNLDMAVARSWDFSPKDKELLGKYVDHIIFLENMKWKRLEETGRVDC